MSTTAEQFAAKRKSYLFEFFDGRRARQIDAWKAVIEIREKLPLETVQSFAVGRADIAPLVAAFRSVAKVPEWDEASGEGLTDAEAREVVRDFLNFVEGKKKAPSVTPI